MNNINFPHIQVITASAGSGKTFKLSERYVEFILSSSIAASPRNILAITFTNKAALEMKERIILKLKSIALGDSYQKHLAEIKLKEILDKYSDFKIQTIDSFLTSITTASALELDIPPYFEIVLDSSFAVNFVLDELLSQVSPHPYNKHNEITLSFLDLLNELLDINPELGWDIRGVIIENINKLRKVKGYKIKKIFSYQDKEDRYNLLTKSVKRLLEKGKHELIFNQHFIKAATAFIEDKKEPWSSQMFYKESIEEICKKGSVVTTTHEKMWQKIQNDISSLAEIISHYHFAPFIKIITLFDKGIQSFKKQQQIIFIEDLNIQLKSFLEKQEIVPEIYFHLGDRISHFFIDEFQDTNRLQWENLFPLIEETLSKKGSLFYVGDKKQSIYGFRGSESSLFDEAKYEFTSVEEKYINEESPEINYRSRENIVSFVNQIFSKENLTLWINSCGLAEESIDLPLILKTYAQPPQEVEQKEEQKGGLIKVEKISPDKPLKKEDLDLEIEKRLIGLLKNDILKRFSPGNIAILVRTNMEASWITGVLSGANIPVASEKTLDISSNNLVQEIVSFLLFLDSPIDNFSFASFISGDIFLKASSLDHQTIFSFLLQNRRYEKPLYVLFRDKFPQIWLDYLKEYMYVVGFLPPYDLVSRILKKYNVFYNFPDKEGFFYQLLEVLKQCESEGKNSLKAFLAFWSNPEDKKEIFQVVLPEYADAIKVQTIHKAKGLGFSVVISPFTYLNNAPITEIYEKDNDDIIPYRINKNRCKASSKLRQLYKDKFTLQLINELNTFYVATTRAKDELYIFISNYERMPQKFYPPILFEEPIFESGSPVSRLPKHPLKKEKHIHLPLINEWQDKLHRPLIDKNELIDTKSKIAQERGILIHDFLANLKKLSPEWNEELKDIFTSLSEAQKEIVPLMKQFFNNESIRKWFVLPGETTVYCEKEIVDAQGLRYRADRILIFPEKVLAIEFKTGEPQSAEHQKQVTTYMNFLAEIYPDKKVEGWLVYIDENTFEEVKWEK
ncbi:MAG: UvrD-helicase domain-containing protein [bacterium]|nr:UvrD-helicase domain-containing protein [bacterium]